MKQLLLVLVCAFSLSATAQEDPTFMDIRATFDEGGAEYWMNHNMEKLFEGNKKIFEKSNKFVNFEEQMTKDKNDIEYVYQEIDTYITRVGLKGNHLSLVQVQKYKDLKWKSISMYALYFDKINAVKNDR